MQSLLTSKRMRVASISSVESSKILLLRDSRFKSQAAEISDVVIGAKRLALGDEEPEKIAEFIGMMVR